MSGRPPVSNPSLQPPIGSMASVERRTLRVLGELGKGSFGVVWHAEVLGEGGVRREVALKVLHRGQEEEEIVRRLRDEARMLALIHHPGVVQVDSLLKFDGRWAVMMEYIDGADVARVLDRLGAMPPRVALEIASEVARVLNAARETLNAEGRPLKLIHRDIKPSNIRITHTGAVKVLDFGVARAEFGAREASTTLGSFGTLPYMSPERLEFQDGPEGDIYAVGVMLYEMLLGERFGRTRSQPKWHEQHLDTNIARLKPRLPTPDPGIAALLRSALAFDPAKRPTAQQLEDGCDTLADAVGGERLKRWAARAVGQAQQDTEAPVDALVEVSASTYNTAPPEHGNPEEALTVLAPSPKKAMSAAPPPQRGLGVGALVVLTGVVAVLTILVFAGLAYVVLYLLDGGAL